MFGDNVVCPKCGKEVSVTIVMTYPAITCYKCTNPNCDYHHDSRPDPVPPRTIVAPL